MSSWNVEFKIHGAIKLAERLHRSSTRALKAASDESEIYTQIMLREAPNAQHMRMGYFSVAFTVKAKTQQGALDAGTVYVSQLCDLLSFVTRVGTEHEVDEESRLAQNRRSRYAPTADRLLAEQEWLWIIGSLPHLHLKESRFMSACSWYRRGIGADEITERLCCLWRVIERCAFSYSDQSDLEQKDKGRTKAVVKAFRDQFFESPPELMRDDDRWIKAFDLRNDISHGNEPLSPKLIGCCSELLDDLEDSAHKTLKAVADRISKSNPLKALMNEEDT
jgi:hypothetical protein